jgi:hypothetical protein
MNLTLYFRLILMSIFQTGITYDKKDRYGRPMSYDNQHFFCPKVYAKDGFSISLQINRNNYCSSENGYREFGHTMQLVEFGFPSEDDILLHRYSEEYGYGGWDDNGNELPFDNTSFSAVGRVGNIPVSVLEELFAKRGGIDWEKTISVEAFDRLTKRV